MKNNKGFTIRTKHKRFILRKKHKGFTLVELIAVIVVIVILAAIALPRIGDMQSARGRCPSESHGSDHQ
jgi:prepilin-type N-terminal cleavage/methylation domain-containing protein